MVEERRGQEVLRGDLGILCESGVGRRARGADRIGDVTALTDGYSAAFLGAAGIAVAGAALAAALLRTPKAAPVAEDAREAIAA